MSQPWTHTAGAKAYPRVDEWYVEPLWTSKRLFEVEDFAGAIHDPCCGLGRIVNMASKAGYKATGADIVDRGEGYPVEDFFAQTRTHNNIVCNPPFESMMRFVFAAEIHSHRKTAVIFPTARLNAARWLTDTPLRRIWLLTPRPSMPPGRVILAGGKVGGGKSDYCWLVMERGYVGRPEVDWLHRDTHDVKLSSA
jgi:hypothetical protein